MALTSTTVHELIALSNNMHKRLSGMRTSTQRTMGHSKAIADLVKVGAGLGMTSIPDIPASLWNEYFFCGTGAVLVSLAGQTLIRHLELGKFKTETAIPFNRIDRSIDGFRHDMDGDMQDIKKLLSAISSLPKRRKTTDSLKISTSLTSRELSL